MPLVVDHGDRASGKSTRAIEWALENPGGRAVVVPTFAAKRDLQSLLVKMEQPPTTVEIWTWREYVEGRSAAGKKPREIWIDEIRMCLPGHVVGISGL